MFRQSPAGARHGWHSAGRERAGTRGPGCFPAGTLRRVPPLLPSRRFPAGTDRNQGQFFSLSVPRVTSLTARAGSADPAGMAVPGMFAHPANSDTGEKPQRTGAMGGAQPQHPTADSQAQLLGGSPAPPLPSPHPQLRRGDPALLGCPDHGAPAASSPRPPPSHTQTPALPDAHELFTYI